MKHQIDELKDKVDRFQMKVEAKEHHIGRLQQENKQDRRSYMTATKNNNSQLGCMVEANLIG